MDATLVPFSTCPEQRAIHGYFSLNKHCKLEARMWQNAPEGNGVAVAVRGEDTWCWKG